MDKEKVLSSKEQAYELARAISEFAYEKKSDQVVIMDMAEVAGFTDYFVIVSGDTEIQVRAIADNIQDRLADYGIRANHKEGHQNLSWVLLDFVDVVVHVFSKKSREYYNLEGLWSDAPKELVEDQVD